MHKLGSPLLGFPMTKTLTFLGICQITDPSRSSLWLEDTTNQSVLPSTAYPIQIAPWVVNRNLTFLWDSQLLRVLPTRKSTDSTAAWLLHPLKTHQFLSIYLAGNPFTALQSLKPRTSPKSRVRSNLLAQANEGARLHLTWGNIGIWAVDSNARQRVKMDVSN